MVVNKVEEQPAVEHERPYTRIFVILAVLTVIEVTVGLLYSDPPSNLADFGPLLVGLLIGLAIAKAYFVAAYFMGIKFEEHPLLVATVVFGIPLFIGVPVALVPVLGHLLIGQ